MMIITLTVSPGSDNGSDGVESGSTTGGRNV